MESARLNDAKETAALWQSNAALREGEFGNAGAARQDADAALELAPGRDVEILVAMALARVGEAQRAGAIADKLNKEFPSNTALQSYWLPTIRAAIELNRNNPAKAIEFLQSAAAYEMGGAVPIGNLYPPYVRGQAFLEAREGSQAAVEFQKLLDHRGIVQNLPIGALAHLSLARAYALQGQTAKARSAYQDFFGVWKDADPDISILQQAKSEYAKLH